MIKNIKEKFAINQQVLSMSFGTGVVIAIEKLQTGGDDYYVIEHGNRRSKDYFSAKNNRTIRSISCKKLFEKVLDAFKVKKREPKFDSKKDRIQFFECRLDTSDVHAIVKRLRELICIRELSAKEQRIVDKLIETLEIEASIIYKMNKSESREFISKILF